MVKCCEELNCLMAIVTNCMLTLHIFTMIGGALRETSCCNGCKVHCAVLELNLHYCYSYFERLGSNFQHLSVSLSFLTGM